MSNFQFLHKEWPELFEIAKEAEDMVNDKPLASRMICRQGLEKGVSWMYDNDGRLEIPHINTLGSLITAKCFKPLMEKSDRRNLIMLQEIGNAAVHRRQLKEHEADNVKQLGPLEEINVNSDKDLAHVAIRLLFQFYSYFAISYSKSEVEIPSFNESIIPTGTKNKDTQQGIEALKQKLENQLKKDEIKREELEAQKNEIEGLRKELEEKSDHNAQIAKSRENITKNIPQLIPESVTRKLYIDVLLKEAGWHNLAEGRELEYQVKGMPPETNPTGIGYADYVLWGTNGKPIAVIEAKSTSTDVQAAKHQAVLYANCLELMHGQRPIIFYSNGFETFIWDDCFYPAREIQGFYTQNELQLLIDRRTTRKDLRTFTINKAIADRNYQIEGIKRVAENLAKTHNGKYVGTKRESLLVMATGSGKTRTAAAIVDMLTKCNWAKRVLFLADRNALVTQAKNAFKEHLENLSAIDLTREKEDGNTRVVFSTYPTMINKIDKLRKDNERFYGVGHFDLIIIDEAHRSVYQKYRAIFEYFDSMLIGLTATPKNDIDHNTYELFNIENNDPTFAYELDEAVEQGFLVPPKSMSIPLKFEREGIRYADLSDEEKKEYEEKYGDPTANEVPDTISSSALNTWLFNTDTVDKVLDHLMQNAIKVSGGDKIGKTIIFAKNHEHAQFIEERFNKNYPEFSGKFLRVIDNYADKAQDLLEKFTDSFSEQEPQIAVSVDMMDTGIDAPRVVNLVFFKIVRSASKFWQMIGRGTRLCPDLFGPGQNKKEFIIFDYCQNFEFFDEHPEGFEVANRKPILQQIFEAKLQITQLIKHKAETTQDDRSVRNRYLLDLYNSIRDLDENRFVVRKQLRYVKEFSYKDKWMDLSKNDIIEINNHLSHLAPTTKDNDELAKRFDLLILTYQILLLTSNAETNRYKIKIARTAASLVKKDSIPDIINQLPFLKEIQTDKYWESISVQKLEVLRINLRDLIKYLETENQEHVYTNFEDHIDLSEINIKDTVPTNESLKSYKERVESYVRENKNHLTIHKLCNNTPITKSEINELERMLFTHSLAGSKQEFIKQYGKQPLGKFIRSITGIEEDALNEAFSDFLSVGNLKADQMTFINTIISYLSKNGIIDKSMLFEPPFTDQNDQGISGVFDNDAEAKVVKIIDEINSNAEFG